MQFGILGPLEVVAGDRLIDLGRPQQRAVLAVLLLEPNRVVPLDRLIDLLWGGRPPPRAVDALQVHVAGLRRALEPERPARTPPRVLLTRPPGYLLRADPDSIDAHRFETLAMRGHRLLAQGRAGEARPLLAEALALWRGPALAEFAFERFAQTEAARLEELRDLALEDRLEADLTIGDAAAIIPELERRVGERPFRERLWALLMLALYRTERQYEALAAYARARSILADELGVEPGPVLRTLHADIVEQSPALEGPPSARLRPTQEDHEEAADRPATVDDGRLVGRAREIESIARALHRLRRGGGGLVLVSGEPGIGKTRLVEELAARAARGDPPAEVVWGRCHEGEGAPSLWPWMQIIRCLIATAEPEAVRSALAGQAGEIAQIAPEIGQVVEAVPPAPAPDPASARFRLYEAVARFLARLASSRPLVVVLEDLHWADVGSLQLLQLVADEAIDIPLLVVGTYRDVDPAVGRPLGETLGALVRHPHLYRLVLSGLRQVEVGCFIAQTAGVQPSATVTASVHARTDGNPFFVAELTRLLASEGALGGERPLTTEIPAGVRDVIRRRLARLPQATNDLLAMAALLGRDVKPPVLAAAAETDEETVLELIDASVAVGILVEEPEGSGTYRFSHALVQEAISSELGALQRARLHARAARALGAVAASDDAHVMELAHHMYEARSLVSPEEAYAVILAAAEVAQRRLAYEDAEVQLRRALELVARMPKGPERGYRELDVQHRLAALLSTTAGYHSPAVADAWQRAHELCRDLGDTPELLSSLWGLARLTRTRAQFQISTRLGAQLLELADQSRSCPFALAGHETLGLAAFFTGSPAAAAEHLSAAVRLSDERQQHGGAEVGVLHPGASGRAYLACVRWMLGDEDAADRLIAQALTLGRSSGHPLTEAIALLYAGKLSSLRALADQAVEWAARVRQLAEEAPIGPLATIGAVLEWWGRAHRGDAAAAEGAVVRALDDLRASGWRLAMTYFLALRSDVHRLAGHLDEALAAVETGVAEAAATGERYYEAELYRRRGEIHAARAGGRTDEAEHSLRRAVTVATEQGAAAFRRRAEASLALLPRGHAATPP